MPPGPDIAPYHDRQIAILDRADWIPRSPPKTLLEASAGGQPGGRAGRLTASPEIPRLDLERVDVEVGLGREAPPEGEMPRPRQPFPHASLIANEPGMMLTRRMSSAESPSGSSYLDTLNAEQRAAADFGISDAAAGPLLVIAGAGTGKTNTLAHRVVRLIEAGADPFRILLLTFSRRAADEMMRRTERIAARALGKGAAASLAWAGTFHAVGARLLREHADQLGLDVTFSILDREDSADLMGLIRHELGLSSTKERFPTARTCPRSIPGWSTRSSRSPRS